MVTITAAAAIGGCVASRPVSTDLNTRPAQQAPAPVLSRHPSPERGSQKLSHALDIRAHSISAPSSIWVVVNKQRPITPLHYRPNPVVIVRGYQLAPAAAPSLERMLDAAGRDGVTMRITSAFRSYEYQDSVHQAEVARVGIAAADLVSARPGYSEHQTGLAVDFGSLSEPACNFDACFARTREGRWLHSHANRFGFMMRYRTATTEVTGYQPEPWHLRYVGHALAAEVARTGATLEQIFGVPGGGNYRR